jgi:hypothetical protein
LSTVLLCAIHGATVENNFFENGDDAITFCAFNPIQTFLHLKMKLVLTRCRARANMLAIILLRNGYYLNCIEIIFFIFEN